MPEQIEVRAVRTGGVDYLTVPTRDEAQEAVLRRERAGYIQRGLPDRVAAVDEQLRLLRGEPADASGAAPVVGEPGPEPLAVPAKTTVKRAVRARKQ
jgi:hypothetical protein